ncbi:MAG: GntR family transcriptional regulator [Chloroflexi bacterium]|nr:GntR family transcriptional regulator [Chloroflexota bacterium]
MRPRLRVGDLVLDKSSMVPLYLQVKQHLIHLISYGTWQPNTPVPSVRQLAADLQMATATVQRVYNELQAEGLLVGRPGRGVFVTELARGLPARRGERSEILRALLAHPIAQARSLGFADVEVLETVDAIASGPELPATPPRVVFVGSSEASIQKYPALLREALDRLGVVVEGVTFADVERDERILDAFEPIQTIVALIGTFPHLQQVARRRDVPMYGLVLDLSEMTQRALIDLPPEGDVALIGQRVYLPSARAILRQFFVGDDRVRTALPTDVTRVRKLLDTCPIVVHTLAATAVVQAYAPPTARRIELEYLPNPTSLTRLAHLLAAPPAASAPDGTAPDGTVPDGTVPDGTVPDGSAPDGSAPVAEVGAAG